MNNAPWGEKDFRLIIGRTGIEYDPEKEILNRKKHGYSFESAVYIFQRLLLPIAKPAAYFISDPIIINDEIRHNHMTLDDSGNVVFIVTTMRPDEKVRIISFRRASENEIETYKGLCRNVLKSFKGIL